MFARYFVELPYDRDASSGSLDDAPRTWLPGLADRRTTRGDRLLAEVGFGDDVRIARTVAIELGEPIRLPDQDRAAPAVGGAGAAGLFPSLDADLEVAPLGARSDASCR